MQIATTPEPEPELLGIGKGKERKIDGWMV
jgi:hypothetical protein